MRLLGLLLATSVPLLAGCGEERSQAPDILAVQAPEGVRRAAFPAAGMAFERPANWTVRRRPAPAVFEVASGEATVAGWAYVREEPLPETDTQLERARERLLEAIEARDPEFRLRRAETGEVAGSPAIDVRGDQVVARRRLRTRSVHVFAGEVEYVIEALAPPADFALVERRVLRPLLASLELEGELDEEAAAEEAG